MKYRGWCLLALSLFSSAIVAGAIEPENISVPNQTGFYAGLGGSYNWDRVNAHSKATLNALSGFPPLGTFTGTTGNYSHHGDGLAAQAQVGYFQPITESNWLWGLELMYQYMQIKATAEGANKDAGSYIDLIDPAINVTDLITSAHVQTKITDLLLLPAFIGHTYSDGFIYLGVGPALFRAQRSANNSSDTDSGYYIGNITHFSDTQWMWGGAVQAGVAYYLNPSWFLKLNYTYAITGHDDFDNNVAYSRANNGGFNNGTVHFNTSQRLHTQTLAISINKVFS